MSFLNKLTFHNVKKAVASHTQSTPAAATEQSDPAYEAAHTAFMNYHQHLVGLQLACDDYSKHYYGVLNASHTIVHNLVLAAINDAEVDHASVKNSFTSLRDHHAILQGDKEQAIALALNDEVIKPIAEALVKHEQILKTINQRNAVAKELDYYAGKLNSLLQEQHEREAAHKEVSTKDTEKLARNQKKKDDTANMFGIMNSQLVDAMQTDVRDREELMVTVAREFEKIEQRVVQLYSSAITTDIINDSQPGSVSYPAPKIVSLPVPVTASPSAPPAEGQSRTTSISRDKSPSRPGSSPAPPPANPPPPPY